MADLLAAGPLTALVVGPAPTADALLETSEGDAGFEVERTGDAASAAGLARALAPDVVVVDVDLEGAGGLVSALLADPLTESVPVLALGSWRQPEDAAPFVALGVARALAKPVTPEVLRSACVEASATYLRREVAREPLGATTVDKLGVRLAEELRRGLCDAADARGRAATIDLGEGDEVLAALWGAVARIRDLVTIRSRGVVQFSPSGPEGALPMAPWLGADGPTGAPARSAAAERAQAATGLEKMVVLVADDDPAVTWFLAGALRAAGAIVHEARDGAQALELAFRYAPDLVVSDVLMPRLDGFALCRALKRDVVLRDVPVILLSWKEDLLQRVRELGADADGYLRKEASAGLIVQRVREVMRPRHRVAQRLAGEGEVRGRVDGLTARTLLAFTCAHRPSSTLAVRDASFLYEIEIRAGRPAKATRTAADGSFERGPAVLASLLGVGAGRFVVTPAAPDPAHARPARGELSGTLGEQLVPLVAAARAAQRLLSGAELVRVERVGLARERLAPYVGATPEPARSILGVLADGESPRALLLSGQVPARLLEDLLCDAAAHGAVTSVIGPDGVDLLPAATEREGAVLRGQRISTPPPALSAPEGLLPLTPFAGAVVEGPPPDEESGPVPSAHAHDASLDAEPAAAPPAPAPPDADADVGAEALLGWVSPSARVEPRFFASPPPAPSLADEAPPPVAQLGAEEVSTRVPSGAEPLLLPLAPPTPEPSEAALPVAREARQTLGPVLTLSFTPPPIQAAPPEPEARRASPASARPAAAPAPSEPAVPMPSRRRDDADGRRARDDETPSARRYPRPSAYAPEATVEPPKKGGRDIRFTAWLAFAAAGLVFAVGARWSREHGLLGGRAPAEPAAAVAPAAPPQAAAPPANAQAAPPPAAQATGAPAAAAPDDDVSVQDLPLRTGDKLPAGQGRLEIVAGSSDMIYVDGQMIGKGPIVRLTLAPKTGAKAEYEVRVKLRGEERVRYVAVKEGRVARVRVAPPWSR
jgi:DNA-binding response OmpR family regulator